MIKLSFNYNYLIRSRVRLYNYTYIQSINKHNASDAPSAGEIRFLTAMLWGSGSSEMLRWGLTVWLPTFRKVILPLSPGKRMRWAVHVARMGDRRSA